MAEDLKNKKSDNGSAPDFSGLILGFSSAALYHIGQAEVDGQITHERNFTLAQHNIEIIRMLQNKTKGNLSENEENLVKEVLEDLGKKFQQAEKDA